MSSDSDEIDDTIDDKTLDGRESRFANFNKKLWMNSYSQKFELPTSHVLNARTFAHGKSTNFHIMQLIKFIIPSEFRTGMKVQPPLEFFDDLNDQGNIVLRVLEPGEGSALKLIDAEVL
jgi:hypothetical protein